MKAGNRAYNWDRSPLRVVAAHVVDLNMFWLRSWEACAAYGAVNSGFPGPAPFACGRCSPFIFYLELTICTKIHVFVFPIYTLKI